MTISLASVSVEYSKRLVVGPITETVQGRGLVALRVGPNGAGKTTLLKAIAGQLPFSGTCTVGGIDSGAASKAKVADALSLMPQKYNCVYPMLVTEFVGQGLFRFGRSYPNGRDKIAKAIAAAGCQHIADKLVTQLSGGELQLALLAQTICQDAGVWLLDEPAGALDIKQRFRVFDLLKKESASRLVVVSSHHVVDIIDVCDHILILQDGQLIASDRPDSLLRSGVLDSTFGVKFSRLADQNGETIVARR